LTYVNVKPENLSHEAPPDIGPSAAAAAAPTTTSRLRLRTDGTWGEEPEDESVTPPPWYDEDLNAEFLDSGIFDEDMRKYFDMVDKGKLADNAIPLWPGTGNASPLHLAALTGDIPLLRALLVRGARIDHFGSVGGEGPAGGGHPEIAAGTPVLMILAAMMVQGDVVPAEMRCLPGKQPQVYVVCVCVRVCVCTHTHTHTHADIHKCICVPLGASTAVVSHVGLARILTSYTCVYAALHLGIRGKLQRISEINGLAPALARRFSATFSAAAIRPLTLLVFGERTLILVCHMATLMFQYFLLLLLLLLLPCPFCDAQEESGGQTVTNGG
jgi:hypothetical protein